MRGVLVGMQEADGDGTRAGAGDLRGQALERGGGGRAKGRAVEEHAFVEAEAEGAADERAAGRGGEVIELGAILAADFEEIFEAGGGDEGGSRAFPFE